LFYLVLLLISLGGKTIGTHTQVLNTDYVPTNALGSITAITDGLWSNRPQCHYPHQYCTRGYTGHEQIVEKVA